MKTPLELIIYEMENRKDEKYTPDEFADFIKQYLPDEKQMVIDAFSEGHARFTECEESELEEKTEQYFNELKNKP